MTWWQAVILGLVEGITEYLPVSSTGHLILTAGLLGLTSPEAKSAADTFNIVIQGGAVLAVLGLYWPRIVQMISGVFGRDPDGLRLLLLLVIAFIPAAVLGPILDDVLEAHLFHPGPVLAALFIGGLWMIWLDRGRAGRAARTSSLVGLSPGQALLIGLLQCVSMWPGTSRSMMTITGGMIVGLAPTAAAEFSFLLALPTLGSACVFKLAKNVLSAHRNGGANFIDTLGAVPVAIGLAVATISAMIAVRWLVGFLNRHGLAPFGWYRIALSIVLAGLVAAGVVQIG